MNHAAYKSLRESIGTQAAVSRSLGIARETLARRESGGRRITAEMELALHGLAAGAPVGKDSGKGVKRSRGA